MAATAHARRSWRGSGGEGGWQAIGGVLLVLLVSWRRLPVSPGVLHFGYKRW